MVSHLCFSPIRNERLGRPKFFSERLHPAMHKEPLQKPEHLNDFPLERYL